MFCIKCGRHAEIENLCEKCFMEANDLFSIENFRLEVCDCGSYYDGDWQKPEEENRAIISLIGRRIKTRNKIIGKEITIKRYGNRVLASIICRGMIKPSSKIKEERKNITVFLKKKKCDNCVKILGGYYEAVLQVRGSNSETILKKIKELAKNAGLVETREGCDIRFIKKGDAKKVAKELKKYFGVKESFKFVATKKGEKLYRNYYAIK